MKSLLTLTCILEPSATLVKIALLVSDVVLFNLIEDQFCIPLSFYDDRILPILQHLVLIILQHRPSTSSIGNPVVDFLSQYSSIECRIHIFSCFLNKHLYALGYTYLLMVSFFSKWSLNIRVKFLYAIIPWFLCVCPGGGTKIFIAEYAPVNLSYSSNHLLAFSIYENAVSNAFQNF